MKQLVLFKTDIEKYCERVMSCPVHNLDTYKDHGWSIEGYKILIKNYPCDCE
jgi:hypothetical protein